LSVKKYFHGPEQSSKLASKLAGFKTS